MKSPPFRILFLLLALLSVADMFGTHNRAGEITYEHLFGVTYRVTVTICTDISNPNNADREYIPITWGHGNIQDSIQRTEENIVIPMSIKENVYVTNHTFPGPGSYCLYVEDPNRNADIVNIPSSVDQVFSITTCLFIPQDASLGSFNNSVQMLIPPKGDACVNNIWMHNPGAYDPDGDSLSYALVECTGLNGEIIPGYVLPNDFPTPGTGNLSIDPQTGTVTWDSPAVIGEHNLCIEITEWRQGVIVGTVIRDMQVDVTTCNNQPPEIDELPDLCVVAGDILELEVTATDPNGQSITLDAIGETFQLDASPSIWTPISSSSSGALGTIQWSTDCAHVRTLPYTVFISATDNATSGADLSDFEVFDITVIAPPVQDLTATAVNLSVELDWEESECENATGYKVYRKVESGPFQPGPCETGIPESTGYTLLTSIQGHGNSDFVDEDIPYGFEVCYRVSACFEDGSESIISDEVCTSRRREIPIMTHASVGLTSETSGADTVRWLAPNELDTTMFLPPYFYRVNRVIGLTGDEEFVHETVPTQILDLAAGFEFIDTGIDTENNVHSYRVDIYNISDNGNGEENFTSSSNLAPSIFLQIEPQDESLLLTWSDEQPWMNDVYDVFFADEESGSYTFLATTSDPEFLHEGLMNGEDYCYYIRAQGEYSPVTMIPGPFENYSQRVCGVPIDLTPPCPPGLELFGTCDEANYELEWSGAESNCEDDVTQFNLYYSPTEEGELEYLFTIDGVSDSTFVPTEEFPIGCYAVSALDTRVEMDGSMVMNESELSNKVCLVGCPEYVLPNVISPNGDGLNELFRPFEPWAYVDSVDFRVYSRWGNLLYEASDPLILWPGTSQENGLTVSDGVYFYTIDIYEITLQGLIPRKEHGTIHVFNNKGTTIE